MAVARAKLDTYTRQIEAGAPLLRRRRGRRRALLDFAMERGVQTSTGTTARNAGANASIAIGASQDAWDKAVEALAIAQGVAPPDLADIYTQLADKAETDFSNVIAGSVTAALIATGAIEAQAIAANAVAGINLVDGAVLAAKLADNAVELAKLADGAVGSTKIAAGAVVAGKIAANAVTANEIAAGSIIAGKIAADAVDANQIRAGAVIAGKIGASAIGANEIAANAITANHIQAAAVTAGKISVANLSSIKADIGYVTAGVMEKVASGKTSRFDLTNQRILFDNGTVVKITGLGFGVGGNLIEWVGLRSDILTGGVVDYAKPSTANAIQYLTATGDAYFKGTLNVGTISNSGQTSDTGATAQIDLGPFGSNGGIITVAYSLTCGGDASGTQGSGPAGTTNYSTSHTILLERSVNGGAYSQVASQTVAGSQTKIVSPYDADVGGYPWYVSTSVTGSFTYSDTLQTTQSRAYRFRINARTLGYGTYTGFTQRLAVATEE